jgi:curved DNA-binding protein CbpA
MGVIKTFYDELGIERNADAATIKHAFKEVAKIYHPDRNPPEKQAWAHERMSRFNFICETLLNPDTRKEYDALVRKYEEEPVQRPRRRPREQFAIEREYAQVSVEIMNLTEKYANCRLKMMIGAIVGGGAAILHLSAYIGPFSDVMADRFPIAFVFSYFVALIGGVMMVLGVSDYLGRGQYRRRIRELEERQSFLRQRMYEAWVS